MNKKIIIGLIVVIIIVGGIWYKTAMKPAKKETIKIGVILPLTGPIASLGESAKNGAELAYNNLSGAEKQEVSLIFEDDHFDPKITVTAFNKLVDVDKVTAIICLTSSPCAAVAPLADAKSTPLIAVASAPVQLNHPYVFRLEISTQFEAEKLLNYLKSKNYTRIGSIVALQDGIQAGYKALKSDMFFSAKEVVSETVAPDEKDYRTVIAKILINKPDLIFIGLLPGMAGDFSKQARTLGYRGDFVAFNFIEGEETLATAGNTLDGVVYTQAADPQGWFADKYKSVYNKAYVPGAAHVYDAITLVARVVDKKSGDPKQAIEDGLNVLVDYPGALGVFSSTGNHEFTIPLILKTIKQNQFVNFSD